MIRATLILAALIVSSVANEEVKIRRARDLIVNGQRCVLGAEMMPMPHPPSCPAFVDEDGFCWLGDMGVDRDTCISMKGLKEYNSYPRASMRQGGAPAGAPGY